MLDIIGNIKVDESNPDRVRYLLASIKSLEFLKDYGKFILYLEKPSEILCFLVGNIMNDCGFIHHVIPSFEYENALKNKSYGEIYCMLMPEAGRKNRYFLNFEEDHFCVLDDAEYMQKLLNMAENTQTDIIKTTFHQIEKKSSEGVQTITWQPYFAKVFRMDPNNFAIYQEPWIRYYVGTNHIWDRDFALNFYNRPGKRPHDYEIGEYKQQYEHIAMVPSQEILCSIDDDHDAENSCLLKTPHPKWTRIIKEVDEFMKKHKSIIDY